MNYDEYIREGRPRYELFAKTVAAILQAAIDAGPQEFRLQQITCRAKDLVSLKRKLTDRGLLDSNSIEEELKDLAGCRLIFYTDTDVDRFLNSRLIFENFVVDFDGSKVHHAVGTERSADELYFAFHYLVSLTAARLSLPEYAQFRGMRCEVQLQTILNHAWAETSHDIVYHPAPMQGFGTKQFADIKKRLEKIMNKYLLPAGYEFPTRDHSAGRLRSRLNCHGRHECVSELSRWPREEEPTCAAQVSLAILGWTVGPSAAVLMVPVGLSAPGLTALAAWY
jgi:ppGpp synthetase/RelA/SpoT-type nucleotidyltranferase